MKLIIYLTEDGVKDWDEWHGAHLQAAAGQCPYADRCPIHARSVEQIPLADIIDDEIDKSLNDTKRQQLSLF